MEEEEEINSTGDFNFLSKTLKPFKMATQIFIGGGGDTLDPVEKQEDTANASPNKTDVIQDMMDVIKALGSFGEFRRTQSKECANLMRRIKLFVPLLEEISELEKQLPNSANMALGNLNKALIGTMKLLRFCRDGSKIYLAFEGESVMTRFHAVYDKLHQALDAIPYHELGISDEVKEQMARGRIDIPRRGRTPEDHISEGTKESVVPPVLPPVPPVIPVAPLVVPQHVIPEVPHLPAGIQHVTHILAPSGDPFTRKVRDFFRMGGECCNARYPDFPNSGLGNNQGGVAADQEGNGVAVDAPAAP